MGQKFHRLQAEITDTLARPLLKQEIVTAACGRLSERFLSGEISLPGSVPFSQTELRQAAEMLSIKRLEERLKRELGTGQYGSSLFPLGVLLHIGAGNAAGLGAYSAVEGLLTGNINLLKPASRDFFFSRFLLKQLVMEEPRLIPYIHVFRISSEEVWKLKRLAALADAAVVWGGNSAVRAVRGLLPPDKRLVEWGHKFSFAYVSMEGASRTAELAKLARHIFHTEGQYCSSCQAVFLDSRSPEALWTLKKRLEEAYALELSSSLPDKELGLRPDRNREHSAPEKRDFSEAAGKALNAYTAKLCCALEEGPAASFGGCRIRLLPRQAAVFRLRRAAGSIQTVCLICGESERSELSYLLLRAGAARVCRAGELEEYGMAAAHDGEYALRRYCKIVE